MILMPAEIASWRAPLMESGPFAATMIASYPPATALLIHSICCASSFTLGAISVTSTPSSFAFACAPSLTLTQCWSTESIVIRAIFHALLAVVEEAASEEAALPPSASAFNTETPVSVTAPPRSSPPSAATAALIPS